MRTSVASCPKYSTRNPVGGVEAPVAPGSVPVPLCHISSTLLSVTVTGTGVDGGPGRSFGSGALFKVTGRSEKLSRTTTSSAALLDDCPKSLTAVQV